MTIEFEETVRHLFPTPLLETKLEVTEDLLNYVSNIDYKRTASNDGFMSMDSNVLESPELLHFKKEIDKKINIYFHGVCNYDYKARPELSSSWVVVHRPGDFALEHYHCNAVISGIWYLKTPENCGDICFVNPGNQPFGSMLVFDVKEHNNINAHDFSIKPKKDAMYLFPAQLKHYVRRNESEDTRISLAFNYFIRGEVKSEDHYMRL